MTRAAQKVAQKKYAILVAASVEVTCPWCGEPQPSPGDGSHLWLPSEVVAAELEKRCLSCTACDEPIHIRTARPIASWT